MDFRIVCFPRPENKYPFMVQYRSRFRWRDNYRGHSTYAQAQEQLEMDRMINEYPDYGASKDGPPPTIKPSRSLVWWLWIVITWPRRTLSRFYHRSGMLPVYDRRTGASEYRRWQSALRKWMWRGDRHKRWFRLWVCEFLEMHFCCPRCGHKSFSGYGGNSNDHDFPDHFELLEEWSVGTQDGTDCRYRGWEFCARCGYREIVEEGSL